jgi:transposase
MINSHQRDVIRTRSKKKSGGRRNNAGRKRKSQQLPTRPQIHSIRVSQQNKNTYERRKLKSLLYNLINPQGRCSSSDENKIILILIIQHQLSVGCSPTSAIKHVAVQMHKSHNTIRKIYKYYIFHKTIPIPDTSNRGAGSPLHISHSHHLSSEQVATIHQTITSANQSATSCSVKDIQHALLRQHNITIARTTLQSILHRIGYHYGKAKYIGTMNNDARTARIRTFLIAYSKAIQEQAHRKCVIVYIDESYIHSNHSSNHIWYNPDSPSINTINRSIGKGIRYIILHAMSANGLLTSSDTLIPSSKLHEKQTTAEFVFESVENQDDYHKSMNGNVFLSWIRNRLIPTFKHLYKKKKMVLVLDNASYHHVRGDDWINPNSMNKTELAYQLVELGVTSIKLDRKATSFPQASFYQQGGKWAPTLDEMRLRLKQELIKYPQYQTTEVRKLMNEHGYELIYTPPYTPTVQPIEMIWAYVKNYVGRLYKKQRNKNELMDQIREGFYGNVVTKHKGVTSDLCTKVINHCHKWCDNFIEHDVILDGSIQDISQNSTNTTDMVDINEDIEDELDTLAQTNQLPDEDVVI